MPLPLRFCLPALAGAMSAAILFTGWMPSAHKPTQFEQRELALVLDDRAELPGDLGYSST